jgi:hypothetical protein
MVTVAVAAVVVGDRRPAAIWGQPGASAVGQIDVPK